MVFSRYRTNLKDEKNAGHFNFPKFHSIVHYPEFIRLFGTIDGVDTSHSEVRHKHLVKENFARTNKRDDFEEQIIHHITRQINAKAMDEILLQRHTNTHTDMDRQLEAKVTRPSPKSSLRPSGTGLERSLRWQRQGQNKGLESSGAHTNQWTIGCPSRVCSRDAK